MRKRILALLLVVVLLIGIVPATGATVPICFVAMNDTIPVTLKGGAAPYYTSGKLYLPHTAFNASPNGVGAAYDMEKNTFVLFNADETLIFDLKNRSYTNKKNQVFDVEISFRSGLVYVPASVTTHFGLSVTMLTSRAGYSIIRFTNGEQVYDDVTFVAQAENLINRAAQEYAAELAASNPGPGPETDIPTEEPQEERGPVEVYLAFYGDAVAQSTLDALNEQDVRAAFFLTEDQILTERDLIRAIYAAGHTIGITAPAQEVDFDAALLRANDALDTVLFFQSTLAMLPSGVSTELTSVRVVERPVFWTVEELLETATEPELYAVESGAPGVIASLDMVNASMLKLRETSLLS